MSSLVHRALREQHAKAGLVLGWFGFFIFVLGALSLYRHELTFWIQEEVHQAAMVPDRENREQAAMKGFELLMKDAPLEGMWLISLPTERQPVPSLAIVPPKDVHDHHDWHFEPFDANAGTLLDHRQTNGGSFLYRLHVDLFGLGRSGRVLVAFGSLCMLAVLFSGLILRRSFFKGMFSLAKSGSRSWYEGHCVAGGAVLPFAVFFILSGLVLSAQSFMPSTLFPHYKQDIRGFVMESKGIRTTPDPMEARNVYAGEAGRKVQAQLDRLLHVAEARWSNDGPGMISFIIADNKLQRIEASEGRATELGRRAAAERLVCDLTTGEISTKLRGQEPGFVASLWYGASALHLARFASPGTRFAMCCSALLVAAMIAMGLVLRERRTATSILTVEERCCRAVTTLMLAGLPLAISLYLLAARLLPLDMAGRRTTEMAVFVITGIVSLAHAMWRRPVLARFEQFTLAAVAAGILSWQAMWHTEPGPLKALFGGLPIVFGTCMMFCAGTLLLAFLAWQEWKRTAHAQAACYTPKYLFFSLPKRTGRSEESSGAVPEGQRQPATAVVPVRAVAGPASVQTSAYAAVPVQVAAEETITRRLQAGIASLRSALSSSLSALPGMRKNPMPAAAAVPVQGREGAQGTQNASQEKQGQEDLHTSSAETAVTADALSAPAASADTQESAKGSGTSRSAGKRSGLTGKKTEAAAAAIQEKQQHVLQGEQQ